MSVVHCRRSKYDVYVGRPGNGAIHSLSVKMEHEKKLLINSKNGPENDLGSLKKSNENSKEKSWVVGVVHKHVMPMCWYG